MNYSLERTNII